MQFKSSLFIVFCFLSTASFANTYLDSIGVENLSGKKIIIYKLDPKDNYYSIGRKYGVSPKIIMDFNKNMPLNVGTIIRIPTQLDFTETITNTNTQTQNTQTQNTQTQNTETLHTVVKKETLYSICSLYGMKLTELKKLNNLKTSALKIGQTLKVISNKNPEQALQKTDTTTKIPEKAKETPKPSPKIETEETDKKTADSTETNPAKEIPRNKYGITELAEKGAAVWIDDKTLDATKSYALHRTAPVGTVIKITNPMSGRSVFAKVVGRYTENESTKDVIIVVTKAAAEAIGVIDKRFVVHIGYGISNEK